MFRLIVTMTLCLFFTGCTNMAYYAQAVAGQIQIIVAARPISEIVNDPATNPELKQHLEQAIAIRAFASLELALPDNKSYRSYADLGRPFVLWNVFAAPELSLEPKEWCIVLIGCFNYRGYYDMNDAERNAAELARAGADTYVSGVTAYSTLGYFNDPVLNTFLRFGDQEVARMIFHELAHQLVFVKDDTAFNESFATSVENEGMSRWLRKTAAPGRWSAFETQQKRKDLILNLMAECRSKLSAIYASPSTIADKRHAKAEAIEEMKRSYADLKASWGGFSGYDHWFNRPLNNATFASVSVYTQWLPAFHSLLEQEAGNLPRFYLRVAELARLPKSERAAALNHLMPVTTIMRHKCDYATTCDGNLSIFST